MKQKSSDRFSEGTPDRQSWQLWVWVEGKRPLLCRKAEIQAQVFVRVLLGCSGLHMHIFKESQTQGAVQDQVHALQLFSGDNCHCLSPHKLQALYAHYIELTYSCLEGRGDDLKNKNRDEYPDQWVQSVYSSKHVLNVTKELVNVRKKNTYVNTPHRFYAYSLPCIHGYNPCIVYGGGFFGFFGFVKGVEVCHPSDISSLPKIPQKF